MTTISSRAWAQGASPVCGAPPCGPACEDQGPFVFCAPGDSCFCGLTAEGGCACIQFNVPCGGVLTPCTASTDCGDGYVCVIGTCLGDVCQPLCAGPGEAAPSSGPNRQ